MDNPRDIYFNTARKKGEISIQIFIHYPKTPEKQEKLIACAAKFHAEYVAGYIEKMNCPIEQKMKLIDSVAKTIFEMSKENKD